MSPKILRRVLPLAEGHIRRRLENVRTTLPGMLEMRVNVLDMHGHGLTHFAWAGLPKFGALAAEHHGAVGNVELRVHDATARNRYAEAFLETERGTEPVDRFFHVCVDEGCSFSCPIVSPI